MVLSRIIISEVCPGMIRDVHSSCRGTVCNRVVISSTVTNSGRNSL